MRIRIGSDPHHIPRFGSGSASRACQSGSGRSGSISITRNEIRKLINLTFFQYAGQSAENYEKYETLLNGIAATQSKKSLGFVPHDDRLVLILIRIRIWIWIGADLEIRIRIRIGIKTMPIHHTVTTYLIFSFLCQKSCIWSQVL